jgi:hypothetical protein
MKDNSKIVWIILTALFLSSTLYAWDRHDTITRMALTAFPFSNKNAAIPVIPFEQYLIQAFSGKKTPALFLRENEFNPNTVFHYKERGTETTFAEVLELYVSEPDETMDMGLIHPDQKFMGGETGETARGFRHLFYRKLEPFDFFPTFHIPFREMGQAPARAQKCFDLAIEAAKAGSPYWAYRFLAWSIHYLQDIANPLHSTQIPTLRMLPLSSLAGGFDTLVSRSAQVISNYHFQYESLVGEVLIHGRRSGWVQAITGHKTENFESVNRYMREKAQSSSQLASKLGRAIVALFGESYFDPLVDVPAYPKRYPTTELSKTLETDGNLWEITTKCLAQAGIVTRSAVAHFVQKAGIAGDPSNL